jgi:hypothetical protein
MGKPEYIVMGSWAVHRSTGKIRHLSCKRWCSYYNEGGEPVHPCDAIFSENLGTPDKLTIPEMVITVSECIRKKV